MLMSLSDHAAKSRTDKVRALWPEGVEVEMPRERHPTADGVG